MAKKSGVSNGIIDVNTQSVRTAVTTLTDLNNGLETDFENVKKAISNLDIYWDGIASGKAASKFNKMKSDFCGASGRKAIMNNYIKFLQNAVAMDYEETEKVNQNLSSLFK